MVFPVCGACWARVGKAVISEAVEKKKHHYRACTSWPEPRQCLMINDS